MLQEAYQNIIIFKVYAEKYAEDQDAFFKDYAEAHAKLSNLGAKFEPPEVSYESELQLCYKLPGITILYLGTVPLWYQLVVIYFFYFGWLIWGHEIII